MGFDDPNTFTLPPPFPPRPRGRRRPPPDREIVRRLAPYCRRLGIVRLEIFGSVARGEAQVGSDVDLIATFREIPGLSFFSLAEQTWGVFPFDNVTNYLLNFFLCWTQYMSIRRN